MGHHWRTAEGANISEAPFGVSATHTFDLNTNRTITRDHKPSTHREMDGKGKEILFVKLIVAPDMVKKKL